MDTLLQEIHAIVHARSTYQHPIPSAESEAIRQATATVLKREEPLPAVASGETFYREHARLLTNKLAKVCNDFAQQFEERKQLESRLAQTEKLASIGQHASGVAHDFNNLITAILGYTELAEMELPDRSAIRNYLENVRLAAERAAGLTDQLLAFARKDTLALHNVDLNEILASLEMLLYPLIRGDIELNIAPADREMLVHADSGQILQVLMNLAVNSRDAMPHGGRLGIELSSVVPGDSLRKSHPELVQREYARLLVRDTGKGMTDAVRARIFEPFFTTKQRGRGTGLGLATCYTIVKQFGGAVDVESEVGYGTTFSIYLPQVSASCFAMQQPGEDFISRGAQ